MQRKKGSNAKSIIIGFLLIGLIVFYTIYLSGKSGERRTDSEKEELAALLDYNMTLDYPNTPRDVVKLHNRYFKLLYGLELTDDEIEGLNSKLMNLYCEDLLAINTEQSMLDSLKSNIQEMQDEEIEYKNYSLPEASQVVEFTKDGNEMAQLEVTVTVSTEDGLAYRYVKYILIKEKNQWKIYGWGDSQT